MTDQHIEAILSRSLAALRGVIKDAYNAGREDMRRELMALLSASIERSDVVPKEEPPGANIAAQRSAARATPGTVKPTLLEMIAEATGLGTGVSTADLVRQTNFKENSVRGTLSTLRSEGKIEQRSDLWFIKSEAPSNESEEAP